MNFFYKDRYKILKLVPDSIVIFNSGIRSRITIEQGLPMKNVKYQSEILQKNPQRLVKDRKSFALIMASKEEIIFYSKLRVKEEKCKLKLLFMNKPALFFLHVLYLTLESYYYYKLCLIHNFIQKSVLFLYNLPVLFLFFSYHIIYIHFIFKTNNKRSSYLIILALTRVVRPVH